MNAHLLIIDDEKNIREGLKRALKPLGYKITLAEDGEDGFKTYMQTSADLVLMDIKMPKMDGLELLQKIQKEHQSPPPVIFLTGHGSVETAVEAMRLGAYDFVTKPLNLDKLELLIDRALKQTQLENQHVELTRKIRSFEIDKLILGQSRSIKKVKERIKKVAPSKANVYIYGESGTGKELICDAIHTYAMEGKPLVKVNCAALTPTLLESELFGHEKGAFTGADQRKIGRFEMASGGTIFLDEVSEIPLETQVKLLRVLQERKIERVGSAETIDVDIRIISASNKDLKKQVDKELFREDLFYRLNVIDIDVPPLRDRKGDIEFLASHFFDHFIEENSKHELEVTSAVYNALAQYTWPGNIRELKNLIERLVVLSDGQKIHYNSLPENLRKVELSADAIEIPYGVTMEEAERKIIIETIRYCRGNKTEAAKVLKIGRKTLHRKINEMLDQNEA